MYIMLSLYVLQTCSQFFAQISLTAKIHSQKTQGFLRPQIFAPHNTYRSPPEHPERAA